MKINLTVLSLFLSFVTLAQLPTNNLGEVVFSNVVELENQSKEELYKKAKFWIVSSLKSGDNMVELAGNNSDQVVGTGNLLIDDVLTGLNKVNKTTFTSLNFKFIVFCKKGRIKYEVSNFLLSYKDSQNTIIQTSIEKIKSPAFIKKEKYISLFEANMNEAINSSLNSLLMDFKESMKTKTDNDW